jgi:putative ABC transport system permease protein
MVARRLLLLMLVTAVATSAVAVAPGPEAAVPCRGLRGATTAPHIQLSVLPGVDPGALAALPGVRASSGPFRGVGTSLSHEGAAAGVWLEGRPARPSLVDPPRLTAGTWIRPGTVVVERGLARRLHLRPGDRTSVKTTVGTLSLRVAGVAATSARTRSPLSPSGLAWVLPRDLRRVVPDESTYGATMFVRLADPAAAGTYARRIRSHYAGTQAYVRSSFLNGCARTNL